jgi:hypothetical protein
MTLSGSTPLANVPKGVFGNLGLSSSLPLFSSLFFLTTFLSRSASSGAATVMGAAAVDAVVEAALGLAPDSEPRTPEGVPDDVMESEGVAVVVQEEAPVEGVMIAVCTVAAPPPSHGAHAPLSSAPRRAAASGAAASEGMEVVLGHPPFTRRVTSP